MMCPFHVRGTRCYKQRERGRERERERAFQPTHVHTYHAEMAARMVAISMRNGDSTTPDLTKAHGTPAYAHARARERQAGRRTDRQTDRQTGRHTDR